MARADHATVICDPPALVYRLFRGEQSALSCPSTTTQASLVNRVWGSYFASTRGISGSDLGPLGTTTTAAVAAAAV